MYHVTIKEQSKGASCWKVSGKFHVSFMEWIKVSVVDRVHKYSVTLFERVKVIIAIVLIHLCFGSDSTLSRVKI